MRETTEKEVLALYCKASASIMDGHRNVRSSRYISERLGISRYKARKIIKKLVTEGLLEAAYIGGADEDYIFCYHGYRTTEKAEGTQEYKNAKFAEAKETARIFGGTLQEYWKAIK